jgi:hypothetical protein
MDWSRFAVGGAASRPDSFTGLRPEFAAAVYQMVQDAHEAGIPLQITSAYRSPELQAQLYNAAPPERRGKYVAAPGRSQHNFGTAVDFAVNGSLIRDPNSPEAQWLAANAARYGLDVPMGWEPWQVELAGARNKGGLPPSDGNAFASMGEATPSDNAFAPFAEEEREAPRPFQLDPRAFMSRPNAFQQFAFDTRNPYGAA